MPNTNDLLNRINSKYSTMSKGHKLLADRKSTRLNSSH